MQKIGKIEKVRYWSVGFVVRYATIESDGANTCS